jgi:predicted Rossmann fold flavoprotein
MPSEGPSAWPLVVAGGGAAGFMAAISAAEAGLKGILLLEATREPLAKVLISGGGRCNVTHACWDPQTLVGHYPRGGRALLGCFSRFATAQAVAWFEAHGLELVQEADGRLFPRSNRSSSVAHTLRQAARAAGVTLRTGAALQGAEALPEKGFRLHLRSADSPTTLQCRRLLLATGGHPSGKRIAASLGHEPVSPVPSLFTLALEANPLRDLAGVVMDPVGLRLELADQRFRQRGAVLVTHWGLSGPATLRLTAFAARVLKDHGYRALLQVDWSGGRSEQQLEDLFADLRQRQARRQLASWRPWPELSRRLWQHLLNRCGVDGSCRWSELRRTHQIALIATLRDSSYAVAGRGPFGEEFVTAGGVGLGEVNLATMASRRVEGLYFAGELLDVDGVTGGFNFQHCWSSGWLAGQAVAGSANLVEDGEHG